MTSRERVAAALERRVPDRVPVFELMIDPGVREAILPGSSYEDFAEKLGIDLVITGPPSCLYRQSPVDGRPDLFRSEWGETRQRTGELVSVPVDGPIRSEKDLDAYRPPDPDDPLRYKDLERLVHRFRGRKAIAMFLHDAFYYPCCLRRMENLLADLALNPSLVRRLVDLSVEHTRALIRNGIRLGADAVVLSDDYAATAAPLLSPRHFEEFFLPGIRRLVRETKDCGGYVIKHSDGNLEPLLGPLVETGIDALHPLDPMAGMNLRSVKDRFRICVIGNIDTGALLSDATPARVRESVRETIREAAPGGGYILSSSNSIHSGVRPENYAAMLEAARDWGSLTG